MTARQTVGQQVPDRARLTAGRLSALFTRDQGLCERLNDAGRRLADVCEQLQYHKPDADHVQVAGAVIHRAFFEYRQAQDERRQLAVDVGELSQQLTDELTAAGFTQQAARRADVHALARGESRGLGR
jgi:hypothetical protein